MNGNLAILFAPLVFKYLAVVKSSHSLGTLIEWKQVNGEVV
ncbi:MAG: hypothetical protein O1I36_18320 [Cylindrospermopsis raciborskii PAMP2011]|nr:hypothetical protein [Cylindrospermopsis raciborskii PAMP2011]